MTDSPEPQPELEEVRRLLAEARHAEPMPGDVAGRMDRVLADLSEGRDPVEGDDRTAAVVPLPRQRRRAAAGLLVAAAAIVVGGVAVAQHLPTTGGTGATASAGDVRAEDGAAPSGQAGGNDSSSLGNTGNSGKSPFDAPSASLPTPQVRAGRLVIRSQRFGEDALAGRRLLRKAGGGTATATPSPCSLPSVNGTVLDATYRHAPAALVYHRPSGSSQVVDLYVCGERRPIRSATLPAP